MSSNVSFFYEIHRKGRAGWKSQPLRVGLFMNYPKSKLTYPSGGRDVDEGRGGSGWMWESGYVLLSFYEREKKENTYRKMRSVSEAFCIRWRKPTDNPFLFSFFHLFLFKVVEVDRYGLG